MATTPDASIRQRRTIQVQVPLESEPQGPVWTYPAQGTVQDLTVPDAELDDLRAKVGTKRHQLGEWPSTAICGNDILSSVLYSSGLVAAKAGKFSSIPLLMVSLVLYFFRFIYEEVVTAIPLNGGSYNVLLNTTSKRTAAFGAALGILCYLATGVVSGTSAIHYIKREVDVPVVESTIGLLFVFALLNLWGIAESSVVALGIFLHHVTVLSVLVVSSFVYAVQHPDIFRANMDSELPPVPFVGDMMDSNVFAAIFFGFGAAMLGITGFETSAQFVEEQKPGVFRKTLRNMWLFVTVFNASLSLLSTGVLPMDVILSNTETLLAQMGAVAAGRWLEKWVAIDAFFVLSGAVLTSYVGITGLVRRLAFDRVLPAFFIKQNKWRGTSHSIILFYFVVASSLVLLLNADTSQLAGVYTYAFLGLMALFSFGCMVLKTKRAEIPRDVHAPWWSCIMGFIFVVLGIFANLLGDPKVLMYFALYFVVVILIMIAMMERVNILKLALGIMQKMLPSNSSYKTNSDNNAVLSPMYDSVSTPESMTKQFAMDPHRTGARGGRTITKAIMQINDAPIIFFCKHPDMTLINKAILYVRKNEQTSNLRIVHIVSHADGGESGGGGDAVRAEFESITTLFDHIYPKLKIDFVLVHGDFEQAMVQWISKTMSVPINLMFIAQPGDKAVHKVATLGVRVITG